MKLKCGFYFRVLSHSTLNQSWPTVTLAIIFLFISPASGREGNNYSATLQTQLDSAFVLKGPDYKPRTEHLLPNGEPVYTNRLILEDSPYLIQHAHNPVDWFPWGSEAFEKARQEGKPIFLSIGYSTCHWCHVMERESFDNTEIARFLNANFIAIKVDRERRPDVDNTYMKAIMMMTGQGGWPMSSFLTAEGKTFYGGTYFPPDQFKKILASIHQMWVQRKGEVLVIADRVASAVSAAQKWDIAAATIDPIWTKKAIGELVVRFDPRSGGFGPAPKFPNETMLFLLEREIEKNARPDLLEILDKTLIAMARGGIYDQIGGGFHRYSTDEKWLVPHFEKMLYNQANLARIYLGAYRLTGNWFYQQVARQTLDYVLRDMMSKDGGFFSATDADSEGEEGLFFLWSAEEIDQVLTKEDSEIVKDLYGVTVPGNFEGRNILHLPVGIQGFAARRGMSIRELLGRNREWREKLRKIRDKRIPPLRDEKIVVAWNAMMIEALATGADVLNDSRYLNAAIQAAQFVWNENRNQVGELQRIHLNGRASIPATQDDYAYLSEALIKLYDVSGDGEWLAKAEELTQSMIGKFWDGRSGGFFLNQRQGRLMARPKEDYDGAIPSGNSVAASVLTKLANRTGKAGFETKARATVSAFSAHLAKTPSANSYMLLAAGELVDGQLGAIQFAAKGVVRASGFLRFTADSKQQLMISVHVKPGWHINSSRPLQKDLRATSLKLSKVASHEWALEDISYPVPMIKSLGFKRDRLSLYEGDIQLTAILKRKNNKSVIVPVMLQLQACNDQLCLAPELLTLRISTIPKTLSRRSVEGQVDSE